MSKEVINKLKNNKGDDEMSVTVQNEYRKLDISKIKFSDKKISLEKSLVDIKPIQWQSGVLCGDKKVAISKSSSK